MKAVIQRVSRASVSVDGEVVGEIGLGALILLGVMSDDTSDEVAWMASKAAELRFFEDDEGKMNLSLLDLAERGLAPGVLVVSQFTLAADGRKGRRPSFDRAASPGDAEPLYEEFCARLDALGLRVERGKFGALMEVSLVNHGPATFVLDRSSASNRIDR
ncbi:D-tyrosyl-tRNA(Tyr) deacylase [Planctomycetes bacterium Poly30]|uniref:D-aminoacyl-tRNA deacylase n=1 Tax=Saltatorellus ferox TaxID=2528018 RepID=A0A518EUP8_9BACT|nr:D-tyrosyl-tRNA(Tyr) deacylase [Planctomycetes bacterium Poly30]